MSKITNDGFIAAHLGYKTHMATVGIKG